MAEQENWNRVFERLGELKKGQEKTDEHIVAVSAKVDRSFTEAKDDIEKVEVKLDAHLGSADAHQAAGERRGRDSVGKTIGAVLAAMVAVFAIMKALGFERPALTRAPREEYTVPADATAAPRRHRASPESSSGQAR